MCHTSWLTMRVFISSMVELTDSSHVKLEVMPPPPPPPPPPHIISDVDDSEPGSTVNDDEPGPACGWSKGLGREGVRDVFFPVLRYTKLLGDQTHTQHPRQQKHDLFNGCFKLYHVQRDSCNNPHAPGVCIVSDMLRPRHKIVVWHGSGSFVHVTCGGVVLGGWRDKQLGL